jgi:L-ascorbate metabolism protein UlaG (beta-lactamase superfamily)
MIDESEMMKKVIVFSLALLIVQASGFGFLEISRGVTQRTVDLNLDGIVDFTDYGLFARSWLRNDSPFDIAPAVGDGVVDGKDLAVLAENWLTEYGEVVYIQWLGHASVKIWTENVVIYVDPVYLNESPKDADLVLVTHSHSDHYSPADIARVSGPQTKFIAPADVVAAFGSGQVILPGQTIETNSVRIIAVPAYNINSSNHPKSNNWVGFIIEIGLQRIYCAGDTDLTDEMKALEDINVAFLPAGGTYTMDAAEAAEATGFFKPDLAIPYHWGRNVGTIADARQFAALAQCRVKIMEAGEIISSDNWLDDAPLIAHWRFDESEGNIASDNVSGLDGVLHEEPAWKPENGKLVGGLELDGTDDYVSTDFVLDPSAGPFSVFVWIKTQASGRPIISQANGSGTGRNWLSTNPSDGSLMTDLRTIGRGGKALVSQLVVTDSQWHHIGFVWDGAYRYLYADGTEVVKDSSPITALEDSDGGLYFGTTATAAADDFFAGLIDDVRIFGGAIKP